MQLYSFPYWYLLWINLCDKTRQTEKQLHLHSRTHTLHQIVVRADGVPTTFAASPFLDSIVPEWKSQEL
jgi:hypothetical protein